MWILWLYLLNTVLLLIIAVREVRRPAKALNWLAINLILPVVGFSTTNPGRIRREKLTSPHNESHKVPDSFGRSASAIAHALRHLTVHGLQTGQVQVLINGIETYEKLIESLQKAEKKIDLEYYIYRDDQIGKVITELLIERAASGVQVRFLRDGWGSRKFPHRQISRMIDAGIECKTIFPLRFPWIMSNWNYRDHCKIVTIDKKEAFTGGINIGYEYTGLKPNVGFWRDTHVRIEGEAIADLQKIFDAHWNIALPERMKKRARRNTKTDTQEQNNAPPGKSVLFEWSAESRTELGSMDFTDVCAESDTKAPQKAYMQTLEGNPGIPTPIIREAYFICLTQANRTIDITTPYFVPNEDIIMAIKTAVARGVRVRLLVPRQWDLSTMIVVSASRTYYGQLLEAGVHIYLYEKGMLHAKQMIIDGEIAEVGASNYDMRSFRLNYEVCEIFYSTDVAKQLTEQFERDLSESVPLCIENLLQRSLPQRMIEQGARLISPLL